MSAVLLESLVDPSLNIYGGLISFMRKFMTVFEVFSRYDMPTRPQPRQSDKFKPARNLICAIFKLRGRGIILL
jgi:hypothetical protein